MAQPETMEGTPEQLAAQLPILPRGKRYRLEEVQDLAEPTEAQIAAADARLLSHTVNLGYAIGLDNEGLDAELAREFGDEHAALSQKG